MTDPADKKVLTPNSVHLVRTIQQIHVQLSQMADQKASMLMAATFLVFTLAVGQARAGAMILPILVLGLFALISAVLAVLAVMPKVGHANGTIGTDANILFFGVFTGLSEGDFADRVINLLDDDETTYRAMLRDVYQNGRVLQAKKYRYLAYAYWSFLIGLGLTFVAFLAEIVTGNYI